MDSNTVTAAFLEPRRPGEKVWIRSQAVAELFEKDNKNVNTAIRNMACSEQFRRTNFKPVEIIEKNALGANVNKSYYLMTRDGFMMLAMGFTGERAMQFKEMLINRFNTLEQYYLQRERKYQGDQLRTAMSQVSSMLQAGYDPDQIRRKVRPTAAERDRDVLDSLSDIFNGSNTP